MGAFLAPVVFAGGMIWVIVALAVVVVAVLAVFVWLSFGVLTEAAEELEDARDD